MTGACHCYVRGQKFDFALVHEHAHLYVIQDGLCDQLFPGDVVCLLCDILSFSQTGQFIPVAVLLEVSET